jgi:hypothetical protein
VHRLLVSAVAVLALLVPATARASAQATDTDRPVARTALTGRVIHFNAWGPLRLGMNHEKAVATGMVSRTVDGCAPGWMMTKPYRDRGWVVWRGTFPRMRVGRIVVVGPREHTERGIHVGSTLRRLRHAYSRASALRPSSFGSGRRTTAADDLWFVSVRRPWGVLSFQFAYGARPGPRSAVATIVIARRPAVYWGC